jgi:hypothetical protein
MGEDILTVALNYLRSGFSVIPVKGKHYARGTTQDDMLRDSKAPLVPWTEYQKRHPDPDEVREWFTKYPHASIAILTGKISGIVVVDLDSPEAIEWAKQNKIMENTLVARTSRGYHVYFRYPSGRTVKNTVSFNNMKIDIRGDGGYVIAPPSLHFTGVRYTWYQKNPPADLPEIFLEEIENRNSKTTDLKPLYQGVQKGNRNNALARLCGSWFRDGLTYEECLEMAYMWNERNNPPLPKREVRLTVESIYRRHQTSLTPPKISHERNLLRLPLFVRDKSRTGEKNVIFYTSSTEKVKREWLVSPNVEYGLPGPFDELVFMAINKIISDMPKPVKNPVDIGSLRQIAEMIGYDVSGHSLKLIKESIKRLRTTVLTSKTIFYNAARKSYVEDVFNLFDRVVFYGEETPEGEISKKNLIWLSQPYLDNINANYCSQINYETFMSLQSPIARGIYKIILPLAEINRNLPVKISYTRLCQLLQIEEKKHMSKIKEQLSQAHNELILKGVFKKIFFTEKNGRIRISYSR